MRACEVREREREQFGDGVLAVIDVVALQSPSHVSCLSVMLKLNTTPLFSISLYLALRILALRGASVWLHKGGSGE